MSLFVDSGDSSNAWAKEALSGDERLVTTDHVLVETWLLPRHRLHRPAPEQFWEGLRRGVARVEPVGSADLEAAWDISQAFPDQDFSIVDRTSFAVMQRLGIQRVATFHNHFAVFRYGRDRSRAFVVVR